MEENQILDFNSLPECSEIEINYLESRWIAFDKVKSVVKWWNESIRSKICWFNTKWDFDIINIQTRYINKTWNERFKTISWCKATGVFIDKIEKWCEYLFVVEWLFDFLSMYQFNHNVVWMFNASSIESIEVLKYVISKKQPNRVVLIPDNDKAGQEMRYKIEQQIEDIFVFDISEYGEFKDFNDIVKSWITLDDMMTFIDQQCIDYKQKKVESIFNDKSEQYEKIKNIKSIHKSWKPIEFPVEVINKELWKIKPNDFTIMIWTPNSWKTTFAFVMMLHNMKIWHKVWFLSYEMDFGDILNQYYLWKIPWAMDRFDESLLSDDDDNKLEQYKKAIYENPNFFTYWGDRTTIGKMKEDINKLISVWVDFIIIDNLIKIRDTNSEIQDNQDVIEELYWIKKQKDIGILLLHHTDKQGSIKNLLSYKWTSDVQIKPDNMFYIRRPALTEDITGLSIDEKSELVIKRAKQRLGRSHAGQECSVYFHWWEYRDQTEFMTRINKKVL